MRNLPYIKTFSANGDSDNIDLRLCFAFSLTTTSGSATTGTVKIQVTNDEHGQTGWVDLPSGSITVTAGTTQILTKFDSCYSWAKINLASLSGSNGIVARFVAKGQ